jgi:hypothetical protein
MPARRPDAERGGVAALPHPPRCRRRRRPALAPRLCGSYPILVAVALVAGSAVRVPAGPVLIMAVLLAANALLLAAGLRVSGSRPSRCP